MNLITDRQISWNDGAFPSQYDTVKVVQEEREWYQHGDEIFATKNALRRALSGEYGGAWIEEKVRKKRYFIDEIGWFKRSIREVSKEKFVHHLDTPSTWQKVLGLGLGILALAPGVSEWVRYVPKEAGLGLLALQQRSPLLGILGTSYLANSQPLGTEFQVNLEAGSGAQPAITLLQDQGFIVVWNRDNIRRIYSQRFGLNGERIGSEFAVANSLYPQEWPNVISLLNGDILFTWNSDDASIGSNGWGIFAEIINKNNYSNRFDFHVNNYTIGSQWYSSAAPLFDGGFVIAWMSDPQTNGTSNAMYFQKFDANASKVGNETRAGSASYATPRTLSLENGNFLIAWENSLLVNDLNRSTIFSISSTFPGGGTGIGKLKNGNFVVAWSHRAEIYAQIFNEAIDRIGIEFQVNNYTSLGQYFPSIAGLEDGGFVIVWESEGQDGDSYGIFGQRYSENGTRIGKEFRVNTYTNHSQNDPDVLGLADGGFIVVWDSGLDTNETSVFGQRYDANSIPIPLEIQPATSGSSNIGASLPRSSNAVPEIFSIIEVVYLEQYPITQNGQIIGTFSFSGGTGQINSSNPNVLNIQFNPGFAPEEEQFIPLFSIPSGQASDWQSIQLGDTDFECLEAHAEINPSSSTSGGSDFGLVFTGADSCTASESQIVAGILPIMMN